MIKMYKKGMGSADICDHMLPIYRTRKCWWNISSHLLNLSFAARFRFYPHVQLDSQIGPMDFRREIARILARIETPRKRGESTSSVPKALSFGIFTR